MEKTYQPQLVDAGFLNHQQYVNFLGDFFLSSIYASWSATYILKGCNFFPVEKKR